MVNAVQKSPHFHEIEDRILDGDSYRNISKWLEEECDEDISHVSIHNHKKKYLNVEEAAANEYRKQVRNDKLKPYIKKRLDDIEFCDKIMDIAAKLDLEVDPDSKITALDIYKLALSALDKKRKMLADSPKRETNNTFIIPTDQKTRAKGRALLVEFTKNNPDSE